MQKGLSSREAEKLLLKHGENLLSSEKRDSAAKIFASQFKDLLTLILLGAAAVSVFMGEFIDAFTIMAIVFINAVIGFSQEFKTERTLENLKKLASPKATVFRRAKNRDPRFKNCSRGCGNFKIRRQSSGGRKNPFRNEHGRR